MSRLAQSAIAVALCIPAVTKAQTKRFALESAEGLVLHNVTATPVTLKGKKGLRVVLSDETARRLETMAPAARDNTEQLVVLQGVEFSSGTIEAEVAGEPGAGPVEGARGFVGIAFRLQPDMRTYDAFYLRPTNGRADDQERRNHATQYISQPDWPWFRLRSETPSRYEAYADLLPGEWTRIRIEVHNERARLYVNGQEQPTLVVNDVKSGAGKSGAIALWLGPGTVAHFRNVVITTP